MTVGTSDRVTVHNSDRTTWTIWDPREARGRGSGSCWPRDRELGWVGLGQGLTRSPTHGPRCLPCGTRLGGRTRVSGHKACRTVDCPQTHGGARAREMPVPVCMCPCVSGGGGAWHTCLLHCWSAHVAQESVCLVLQALAGRPESLTPSPPGEMWAWARKLHLTRTSYPTAPRLPAGTGRRWYVARLGSDPHSLTAFGTGAAATWAGSGSPRPRAYPGQVEGPQGAESASLPWVPPVLAAQAAALQPA